MRENMWTFVLLNLVNFNEDGIFLNPFKVVGHLGYFHRLAIVNNAEINMSGQVPLL
jgi:hypothetical protein